MINFNGLGVIAAGNEIFTTLTVDGFQFASGRVSSGHFHLIISPAQFGGPDNGTVYLASEITFVTITKVGGGTFSLDGFDAARMNLNPTAEVITVSNSSGILGTYAVPANDGIGPGADFKSFQVSFTDQTSITFSGVTSTGEFGSWAIDNIVVDQAPVAATSEPASLTLLGIGGAFGLLGYRLRRRKAEATPTAA
jgi:hypothetical protein